MYDSSGSIRFHTSTLLFYLLSLTAIRASEHCWVNAFPKHSLPLQTLMTMTHNWCMIVCNVVVLPWLYGREFVYRGACKFMKVISLCLLLPSSALRLFPPLLFRFLPPSSSRGFPPQALRLPPSTQPGNSSPHACQHQFSSRRLLHSCPNLLELPSPFLAPTSLSRPSSPYHLFSSVGTDVLMSGCWQTMSLCHMDKSFSWV